MLEDRVLDGGGDIIPVTRGELLAEWRSDPNAIFDQARETELPTDAFLSVRAGPTRESPGSTSEWLLYNSGARMVDNFHTPSTRLLDLPDIESKEPLAKLMNSYWDERYNGALMTGERAVNSLAPIESQTVWRPIYDEMPYRQPQIAPAFDFRKILGMARRIREDQ